MNYLEVINDADNRQAYRLQIKVKNNLILRRIESLGYKSISEFCRQNDLHATVICSIISFTRSPILDTGDWSSMVYDLSSALRCEPEDLFTEKQKRIIAKKRTAEVCVTEQELQRIPSRDDLHVSAQNKEQVANLLKFLPPREKEVIEKRYFQDMTLDEVGNDIRVTRERVRQIEAKALRRIRGKISREDKYHINYGVEA